MTDWDAIVIGAGPAGAVAARQIALSGHRVLLVEKKRFPRRKVCGACLNHSAVSLLSEVGLGDVLSASAGTELTRFDLRAGSRRLSWSLPSGRAISRAVLDQELVTAAIRVGVTFRDDTAAFVGRCDSNSRLVQLRPSQASSSESARAKIVLAADGLGHPSLSDLTEINDRPVRLGRVGAGCEVRDFPAEYAGGTIHMAVGRGGYVGLVCVETGALNVAAAFDPALLRDAGGPAAAAARVLAQTDRTAIPALAAADWIGTPALTRTTTPIAAERLFVLGDAAGYVEPFTGEGIGWALASAVAVAPLACAAIECWRPQLTIAWSREHSRVVRYRQRICRTLAMLLKHPTCVRVAMTVLPWLPWLTRRLVSEVNLPMSFDQTMRSRVPVDSRAFFSEPGISS